MRRLLIRIVALAFVVIGACNSSTGNEEEVFRPRRGQDCDSTFDCGSDEVCHGSRYVCVGCQTDNDCQGGTICAVDGCRMTCAEDEDCEGTDDDLQCTNGACVPEIDAGGAGVPDGSLPDGSLPDGSLPDGGLLDGGLLPDADAAGSAGASAGGSTGSGGAAGASGTAGSAGAGGA